MKKFIKRLSISLVLLTFYVAGLGSYYLQDTTTKVIYTIVAGFIAGIIGSFFYDRLKK